ncbi:MAG: hypothetical protein AAF492_21465, partial [Verrucomicrobiota bacterium]
AEVGAKATPAMFSVGIRYVDQDATGLNDGTSWTNAYTNLANALNAANADSGRWEIWVAEGIYRPGLAESDTFFLNNNHLHGGFAGTEAQQSERVPGANPTVLEGDLGGGLFSQRIVTKNTIGYAVLERFTIRNGRSRGIEDGAGTRVTQGTLLLENCRYENNESERFGGAVQYTGGVTTGQVIRGCTFVGNIATNRSGAIDFDSQTRAWIFDCTFISNRARTIEAGAIRTLGPVTMSGCRFKDNQSAGNGGAIRIQGWNTMNPEARTVIRNCVFTGNRTEDANPTGGGDQGGGLFVNEGPVWIVDCHFTNNFAAQEGGALKTQNCDLEVRIEDSTFTGNTVNWGRGGAIQADAEGPRLLNDYTIVNCAFDNNESRDAGGAVNGQDNLVRYRILDSMFFRNTSTNSHGGAFRSEGNVNDLEDVIERCWFIENRSWTEGGAIRINGFNNTNAAGRVNTIRDCVFVSNVASNPPGINSDHGGAMWLGDGVYRVENCHFTNNC